MSKRQSLNSFMCELAGLGAPPPAIMRAVEEVEAAWTANEASEREPTIASIMEAVCERYGITKTDLVSLRRTRALTHPRFAVMYLARHLTGKTLTQIGRKLGNRDHTTVLKGIRCAEELRLVNPDFAEDIAALRAKIEQRISD